MLRVVPFLLFVAVGMVLFVFGFEPFVLGLYRGGALRIPFGLLVAVISLRHACFFRPKCIVHGIDECLPCDVF